MKASNTSAPDTGTRLRLPCRSGAWILAMLILPMAASAQTLVHVDTAGISNSWNGAIFEQGDGGVSAGTGLFDPFYQVKSSSTDTVRGYNTGGTVDFQTVGSGTAAATPLLLSTVTQVEIGGIRYREFFLDINQNDAIYDMIDIQVYVDDQPDLDDLDPDTRTWGASDTGAVAYMIYWLDGAPGGDASVRMDYTIEAGSGKRDVRMLLPDSTFNAPPECDYGQQGCGLYVFHYSAFYDNNDGFEEWSTAIQPFVNISKTAVGALQETTDWTIEKSVSPDSLDLFDGDSADVKYTITLGKEVTQDSITVTGVITMFVPELLPDGDENAAPAEVQSLTDLFEGISPTTITCEDDGSPVASFPYTITPGSTVTCEYVIDLGSETTGTNTATASVLDQFGDPQPWIATAHVDSFIVTPLGEADSVNVSDLLDGGGELDFGPFGDDSTFMYSRTFACGADEGNRQNIASLDETLDADTANVDVDCWELVVTKSVETSKVRYYTWMLDKSVDPDALNLFQGDSADTEFSFDLKRTGADSGFVTSGVIKVYNDAPIDAEVALVVDTLDVASLVPGVVDCGGAGPYTVVAGDSLTCAYTADVADDTDGDNTAYAYQQNYNIDYFNGLPGDSTATDSTVYTDTEPIDFNGTTSVTYVDSSATLNDSTYAGVETDLGSFPNGTDCGAEVANELNCQVQFESRFACDQEGHNKDVAFLVTDSTGTVLTDTADVYVECYEISVAKDDSMEYTIGHVWDIDKSVVPESIAMFYGDTHDVEWTVAIDDSSYSTDWRLFGNITITNPNPDRSADLTSVADTLNVLGEIAVSCDSLIVEAGGSLVCTYDTGQLDSTSYPFGTPNTATAYRQNYNFDKDGIATPTGTTRKDGTSVVNQGDAAVTDTTSVIHVTDTNPAAYIPPSVTQDTSWTYTDEYACVADSGDHKNIAEITETGLKDSAEVRVDCYQLAVEKDAQTTLTQNYEWTIEKGQDTTWSMFYGDSAISKFTIDVTKSTKDSTNFMVAGNITVYNNTPIDAVLADSVGDKILGADVWADVSCPVTFPDSLKAGEQLDCTYMSDLPNDDDDKNIAYAWQQNYDYDKDGNASADGLTVYTDSVDFDFEDPIVIIGADSSATATDDLGTPGDAADDSMWTFDANGSKMYEKGFSCDDEGTTTNKVVLVGDSTGMRLDSATATVTVDCYELEVTKTAVPSYKRGWGWTIVKSNVQDTLLLMAGQTYIDTAYYEIDVEGIPVDSAYRVAGMIVVDNSNPIPAEITGVGDIVQLGNIDGQVDCDPPVDSGFPYVIPPDSSLTCSYGPVDLPNDDDRENQAWAGLQAKLFHYENSPVNLPDTSYYADSVDVIFTGLDPAEEYDECIVVTDSVLVEGGSIETLGGFCGTTNPSDTTFTDSLTIVVPGDYNCANDSTIINSAKYTTNDNGTMGQDTSDVVIDVPCPPEGCTLTLGYWKTHNESFWGGAPPDDTWCLIGPKCELETFFLSDTTWFGVFWTKPQGNKYYNLAWQWMAATLNTLNGASTPPEVQDALDQGLAFFQTTTPGDMAVDSVQKKNGDWRITFDKQLHAKAAGIAGILGAYNEGSYPGVPHCHEDNTSSLTIEGAPAAAATVENAAASKADVAEEIPTEFDLGNYPNPFNPTTTILVALPEDAKVTITVYDVLGRRVTSLIDKDLKAGYHRITWDAGNLPSGQYFYSLQSEQYQRTKKMLLLK